jgi:hypothetical protein
VQGLSEVRFDDYSSGSQSFAIDWLLLYANSGRFVKRGFLFFCFRLAVMSAARKRALSLPWVMMPGCWLICCGAAQKKVD